MLVTIGKEFHFEAAHHLPGHDGKCRQPHGHSYRVLVEVRGELLNDETSPKDGMVLDFADLSIHFHNLIFSKVDHTDLNVSLHDIIPVMTAECLAVWILHDLARSVDRESLQVKAVTVWETASSFARAEYE